MKKAINLLFLSLIVMSGCKQETDYNLSSGKLELYLLKSYNTVAIGAAINSDQAVIEETPLIDDSDILSYNKSTCTFTITSEKAGLLKFDSDHSKYHQKAFAVTINREVIYTGYFWYAFSSQSVNWIVIDPIMSGFTGQHKLQVQLGYPSLLQGMSIPDHRNDDRIINLMKATKRLVE